MLTSEIKALDAAFSQLVKQRRGNMIRRGGAGSRDFEISIPHRGHEVLVGVETGWFADDAMFLFVRHARAHLAVEEAHPFHPPRPADLPEVIGTGPTSPIGKSRPFVGGRAGTATAATPSAPARSRIDDEPIPLAASIPGFSVSVHQKQSFLKRMRRAIIGPAVYQDRRRPGWFHAEMAPGDNFARHLEPELSAHLTEMAAPPLSRLSIAMTAEIFRVKRQPVLMDVEEVDRFVTTALAIFTAAVQMPPPIPIAPEPGLVFELLVASTAGRCGVCGDLIETRRVDCAKCQTPHHDECWRYGGGCSVYGCGSRLHAGER